LLQVDYFHPKVKKRWYIGGLCFMAFVVVLLLGKKSYDRNISNLNQVYEFAEDNGFYQFSEDQPEHPPETLNPKPETFCLINILDVDSDILVDLKYATTDNFTGKALYEGLDVAYLQPDVAQMLTEAHRYLKTLHPGLRLLVYDAARPLSVQQTMWESVKDTQYSRYVAHPDRLSLHNFGAAVDITLADSLGQPLDMGTPFDFFGRAAGISDEQGLINQGLLNRQQVQNRQLLRQVMRHAGFRSISGEWWHFNACTLQEAKQRYTVIL